MLNVSAPEAVAKGEVEMGLGPVSEIIQVSGTQVVGEFPGDLQSYLVFSGGVAAASKAADAANSLMKFLVSPAAVPVLKTQRPRSGLIASPIVSSWAFPQPSPSVYPPF